MKFNLATTKFLSDRHSEVLPDQLYLDIKVPNYVRYKRRGRYVMGRFYKSVGNYPVDNEQSIGITLTYLNLSRVKYHRNGVDCTDEVKANQREFVNGLFG